MSLWGLKPRIQDRLRRGVTAVEFALLAPIFFLFLLGVVELSLMLLTQHLMENTVFNASRLAKTGYVAEGQTQLDTVIQEVTNELGSLSPLIDVSKAHFTYDSYGDLTLLNQPDQAVPSLGSAQEVVVFTLSYPWTIFTPVIGNLMGDVNRTITLTSQIVVRNEPYSTN